MSVTVLNYISFFSVDTAWKVQKILGLAGVVALALTGLTVGLMFVFGPNQTTATTTTTTITTTTTTTTTITTTTSTTSTAAAATSYTGIELNPTNQINAERTTRNSGTKKYHPVLFTKHNR